MNKLLIFITMALIVSCSTEDKRGKLLQSELIEIDVNDIQTLTYSKIFQLKDIVLFDSPDIVVSNIEKASVFKDYIVIKCSGNTLIVKSLLTGISIKIGREGKGPGEYLKLSDFLVDEEKAEIWILDGDSGKVLRYSFEGILQSEHTNNVYRYAQSFYKIDEDKIALYYGTSLFGAGDNRLQIVKANTDKILEKYIEVKEKEAQFMNFLERDNFTSGGVFHFKFHNSLYKIDDFEEKYEISFGKQTLPTEILDKHFNDVRQFVEYCRESTYAYGVTNIIETPQQLLFSFNFNSDLVNCIYDVESKKYIAYNKYRNDIFGLGEIKKVSYMDLPRGSSNNILMFEIEPLVVKTQLEKMRRASTKAHWDSIYSQKKRWIDLYDSLSINSNSLLALVELKN